MTEMPKKMLKPLIASLILLVGTFILTPFDDAGAQMNRYDRILNSEDVVPLGELPPACYAVYRTRRDAAAACPPWARPVEAYDFWTHRRLGWSCKCER